MLRSHQFSSHKQSDGFTMVEILIVVLIIGILVTISILGFNGMQERAYTSRMLSSANEYARVLKLYQATTGKFPDVPAASKTVCLGRTSDYPARDGFPAGACVIQTDGTGAVYANNAFTDEISRAVSSTLPLATTRTVVAKSQDWHTYAYRYRGIYAESYANPSYNYAYLEFLQPGNVPCPATGYSWDRRYMPGDNATWCFMTIQPSI